MSAILCSIASESFEIPADGESSFFVLGYAAGSAAQGSDFAEFITNAGGDIVVVTIQYRLGPFGFLAGQETADFGALNAGLLDQVCQKPADAPQDQKIHC